MTDQYVDVRDYTRARFLQREAERNAADCASAVTKSASVETASQRVRKRLAADRERATVLPWPPR